MGDGLLPRQGGRGNPGCLMVGTVVMASPKEGPPLAQGQPPVAPRRRCEAGTGAGAAPARGRDRGSDCCCEGGRRQGKAWDWRTDRSLTGRDWRHLWHHTQWRTPGEDGGERGGGREWGCRQSIYHLPSPTAPASKAGRESPVRHPPLPCRHGNTGSGHQTPPRAAVPRRPKTASQTAPPPVRGPDAQLQWAAPPSSPQGGAGAAGVTKGMMNSCRTRRTSRGVGSGDGGWVLLMAAWWRGCAGRGERRGGTEFAGWFGGGSTSGLGRGWQAAPCRWGGSAH